MSDKDKVSDGSELGVCSQGCSDVVAGRAGLGMLSGESEGCWCDVVTDRAALGMLEGKGAVSDGTEFGVSDGCSKIDRLVMSEGKASDETEL